MIVDELAQSGQIHEADVFEDYFEFDNLEAERDILVNTLQTMS